MSKADVLLARKGITVEGSGVGFYKISLFGKCASIF